MTRKSDYSRAYERRQVEKGVTGGLSWATYYYRKHMEQCREAHRRFMAKMTEEERKAYNHEQYLRRKAKHDDYNISQRAKSKGMTVKEYKAYIEQRKKNAAARKKLMEERKHRNEERLKVWADAVKSNRKRLQKMAAAAEKTKQSEPKPKPMKKIKVTKVDERERERVRREREEEQQRAAMSARRECWKKMPKKRIQIDPRTWIDVPEDYTEEEIQRTIEKFNDRR